MKLIIIRHGDPDYVNDSLTEKGRKEAKLLADKVAKMKIDRIYASPLGRAQATMKACLDKMDAEGIKYPEPVTLDWLMEFPTRIKRPDRPDHESICWDWMPEDWTVADELYDFDKWTEHPVFKEAGTGEEINHVFTEFEKFLNELGYEARSYQENRRVQYKYEDVEIDVDSWPGIPTFLEIEGPSEEKVYEILLKLGFKKDDCTTLDIDSIYKKYGIELDSIKKLKFEEEIK